MARTTNFIKVVKPEDQSPRTRYELKYKTSRTNLLLVIICTAVNLLLLVTNADSYFLFSAFIPYFITGIGMLLCGRFPDDYYTGEFEGMLFLDDFVFYILLTIAIALTVLYLLAWIMSSKNRVGWLIFSLIFFALDTAGMLWLNGVAFESFLDILFHAWVLYYLIVGIHAHYKLKKLPPEQAPVLACENAPVQAEENAENEEERVPAMAEPQNSRVLRRADTEVKHKILLETNVAGYHVCYRRVKRTNELVVNGNVYDELKALMEGAHVLEAYVDGHYVAAGYTGTHSFIAFDGNNVAKKLRLI